jgi:transposase
VFGKSRSAMLKEVPADGADWVAEVRREVWDQARREGGDQALADRLKGCRYALWKNPERLTGRQKNKLAWVAHTNDRLYRAYLMKEELRLAIHMKGEEGIALLAHWLAWTARCQIPAFIALGAKVRRHRVAIEASLRSGTSNALVESANTKIRALTRVAFGSRSPEALVAMAMLALGGVCPELPGHGRPVAFELAAA